MADNPTMQDYLNAGHTEWVLQNMQQALTYYKLAVQKRIAVGIFSMPNSSRICQIWKVAGVETDEVPLLLDQLRYII